MNPSDAIEAIEKPLSSLPYSLSRHILEHLRKLTSHEPVIGIMGKSGAGKSSLCNALFQGEVTPVSDVHAGTRKKIGPDPRNFNQRVSLGRNDLLIRTFPKSFHPPP